MAKKEKITYLRCSLPGCDNPLVGQQRKFCSRKCTIKSTCLDRKGIYKELDSVGGPRSLSTVESSIKKDETFVMGDGRYTIDDIPIDNDIWEAVELRDELHRLNCIEHENRRVIAGFEEFIKSYNEHHDVAYATMKARQLKEQNG
jgi:uncharacterized protein YktA (UPF0223 family)